MSQTCFDCGAYFKNLQAVRAHKRWCPERGKVEKCDIYRHACEALVSSRSGPPARCWRCERAEGRWTRLGSTSLPPGPIPGEGVTGAESVNTRDGDGVQDT